MIRSISFVHSLALSLSILMAFHILHNQFIATQATLRKRTSSANRAEWWRRTDTERRSRMLRKCGTKAATGRQCQQQERSAVRTNAKRRNYLYSPMVHYNEIRQRERGKTTPHRASCRYMCTRVRLLLSLYSRLVNSQWCTAAATAAIATITCAKNETFANRASSSTRILCYAKQLNWTTTNDQRL